VGEQVYYRNAEELNETLDKAADDIRRAKGPDVAGNVIWWGLVGVLAFLLGSDWFFKWELRYELVPGLDLAKPVGLLIVGLLVMHHLWARRQHERILRRRLCLGCGVSLLGAETDAEGSGKCPGCDREFNVGEYRPPYENRGDAFQGYIDADHFDKAMYEAAEHLKSIRTFGLEGSILGWMWVALGVTFGLKVLGFDLFDWVSFLQPVHFFWFLVMLVWSAVYAARVQRLRPTIIKQRLCMNCGFCLLHTPTGADGLGTCPECGEIFVLAQYERPASQEETTAPDSDSR
jgi:hypothetical protein